MNDVVNMSRLSSTIGSSLTFSYGVGVVGLGLVLWSYDIEYMVNSIVIIMNVVVMTTNSASSLPLGDVEFTLTRLGIKYYFVVSMEIMVFAT